MSWKTGIYHNPSGMYLEGLPQGLGSVVHVRIRAPQDAPIEGVYLRCAPDGEQQMHEARPVGPFPGYDCRWWEVPVRLVNYRFHYRFFVLTSEGGWWYTAAGLSRHVPTDHTDFQILADQYETSWLDTSVFYQIFPDRFADGDPSNNVASGSRMVEGNPAVARRWGDLPDASQGGREFYGGDLQGITQKLAYLQERLGVNALYLNPIGTAPSNHKYDVASYTEVDPHLGGDAAFFELKRALEERGMRLILDIVPNHCGSEHPWFQAALRDRGAPTAEYFTFHGAEDYECWLGIRTLPKLNYKSKRLRETMYEAPDSIMRRWLQPPYSIDGWRIDVANMLARQGEHNLSHKILRGMRRAVKAENPHAYLLGENFFDASSYLQGDQLDATMNYRGFMMPLYHWITGHDYNVVFERSWGDRYPLATCDLELQWRGFRSTVPWAMTRQQFNLLDSHDTPRLLTLCGGDKAKAAVARFILFTYPGVPCIYYGDEVGLAGGRDPDNRRTMPWESEQWDQEWLEGWARLIKLRTGLEALSRGSYQTLHTEGDTLAFLRETRGSRVIAVARRGGQAVQRISVREGAIPDGATFREALSGATAAVQQGFLPVVGDLTELWVES